MKKVYRAHPLMIFRFLKPFLFVLIIPLLEGVVQYAVHRRISGILAAEITVFVCIFLIAVMRCEKFSLSADSREITLQTGIFFRQRHTVRLSCISSVTVRQNPADFIFRAATVSICTEAGRPNASDFEFKLSNRSAGELMTSLFGDERYAAVRFSAGRLAASAALNSSALTGLLIGVPLFNRTGKVFGNAVNEALLNEINTVSSRFNTYFSPIFNTVVLILLGAYGISFVYSLIRAFKFRLFSGRERLEVQSGLFVRRRTAFSRDAVQDISVEQTPLMRIAHRYMLCVSVAGFTTSRDNRAVVIPCGTAADLHTGAAGLPFFEAAGHQIRPSQSRKSMARFLRIPLIAVAATVAATVAAMLAVPYFERFIMLLSIALLLAEGLVCWFFHYLCRRGRLRFGEKVIYGRSVRGTAFCEMYIPREHIGAVRITRTPADMRLGTCNVRLTVRSERGNRIRIWHLDREAARSNLLKFLEIEE